MLALALPFFATVSARNLSRKSQKTRTIIPERLDYQNWVHTWFYAYKKMCHKDTKNIFKKKSHKFIFTELDYRHKTSPNAYMGSLGRWRGGEFFLEWGGRFLGQRRGGKIPCWIFRRLRRRRGGGVATLWGIFLPKNCILTRRLASLLTLIYFN